MNASVDGRSARWAEHNAERRRSLVESALRAIRRHGASVSLDDIAAEAGTSKPVLYRHFGDRTGLYVAVVESVHSYILTNLDLPLATAAEKGPGELAAHLADAYLSVVGRDPEIYRFVITRPTGDAPVNDPVVSLTSVIGDELTEVLSAWLRSQGRTDDPASTWGHGIVGFIWALADQWIASGRQRPRSEIVRHVEQLFAPAFLAPDGAERRSDLPPTLTEPHRR